MELQDLGVMGLMEVVIGRALSAVDFAGGGG
jgi:hypothetical protein